MHPRTLHALAAAHSLDAARTVLAVLAAAEAAQIAAEALEAPSVLRSTVYGGTFGSGGYSDPTPAAVAVADRPERVNVYARRQRWTLETLEWLTRHPAVNAHGAGDPLDRLLAAIPGLADPAAGVVALHLAEEEQRVRRLIGESRPTAPLLLVGVQAECPGCRRRSLTVQQVGPELAWTVVCDGRWDGDVHNPCLCLGAGCGCGMSGAVEGVAHIWLRSDVLGAVAKPCCDLHNRHCEPPGDLCCARCTEASHPDHRPGERCVLSTAGGAR